MRESLPWFSSQRICNEDPPLGSLLASCGMVSVNTNGIVIPFRLQKAFFYESVFETSDDSTMDDFCRADHICVENVIADSNICTFDLGGQLYKLQCGTSSPECVYGVASYYLPISENLQNPSSNSCSNGSVFAKLSTQMNWITKTIRENWP